MMSSKISFYDFLNILVTGFLLLNLSCGFYKSNEFDWIFISVTSFLIGLLYHQLVECTIGKVLRNYSKIISKAYQKIKESTGENPMPDDKRKTYLEAYYLVAKNNCLMNIPVLEAHIAFIRNIWPILLLYLVAICSDCPSVASLNILMSPCGMSVGITAFLLLFPFVLYVKQKKVCELVWEGAYYIRKIQDNEKNSSN